MNARVQSTGATLVNASKANMTVDRETSINVQVVDRYVEILALVTPDLSAQMLLSWHNLVKLGILHPDFPNPIPTEALHVISRGNEPVPLPGDSAEVFDRRDRDDGRQVGRRGQRLLPQRDQDVHCPDRPQAARGPVQQATAGDHFSSAPQVS